MYKTASFLFSLMLLSGCDTEIPKTDYFPIHKGLQWDYKVTTTLTGQEPETQHFQINNLGPVTLKGKYEGEPVSIRHTSDGTDYYILQDDTGTYRIGKRTVIEYDPRYEEEIVRVLPNYKDLDTGRSWSALSKPYALHSTPGYATSDPQRQKILMTYELAETEETVTVPAGTYENCIRIEGTADFSLYADPRLGSQTILITQTEWYAPGVGLIKLIRNEPLELEMFKGGVIIYELAQFDY
ncbi:MAG: TapB family protein [Neptuniibacter sp.]